MEYDNVTKQYIKDNYKSNEEDCGVDQAEHGWTKVNIKLRRSILSQSILEVPDLDDEEALITVKIISIIC